MVLLKIRNVTKIFGGLIALRDVSFDVNQGEILGLIGPNGAGKSTLFNVISGFHTADKGKILYREEEITGMRIDRIAHKGIARIFQEPTLFMQETVFENVYSGFLAALKDEHATNLPHGHQRALAIAVALATGPELLLLDEPVTGMNPNETQSMVDKIRQIRARGITVLIVEHDMKAVMSLCDRIVVLSLGAKLVEGTPEKIKSDERVIEAYLGRQAV
jgi:branched-chain amino acid transport system ATP-binding protein